MTEFLDELARSLAKPMPRRRAIRVVAATIVGASLQSTGSLARAGLGRAQHICDTRVSKEGWKYCSPASDACFPTCCPREWSCCKGKCGSNGCCEMFCCNPCKRCVGEGKCAPASGNREQCGTECCRPGQYCASPARGICCNEGEVLCRILGTPGSGDRGTGGKCCPRGAKCCANDTLASCCGPQQTCSRGACGCPSGKKKCGQRCCDKNDKCCDGKCCGTKETCCDGKCCGEKQTCCSGNCCDKATQKCCPQRCCKKAQTCCGDICCDKDETCCGGQTCCKKGEMCCGNDCCKSTEVCIATSQTGFARSSSSRSSRAVIRRVCCPRPRALGTSRCCPPGTVAGRSGPVPECCPPGRADCCTGEDGVGCLPGQTCVNGSCQRSL